jgi:predicted Zn-dependent protease
MGYDPREMKKTFEYFQRLEQASGSTTPSFLRDHPTNESRLQEIDAEIAKHYDEVLAKKPEQFRAPPGPNDHFVQLVKALQTKAPAYKKDEQARQIVAKQGGDAKALAQAKGLADEAMKLDPGQPLFAITAGEVAYASGSGDKGRAQFEKALALEQKSGQARGHWKPLFYLGALDVDAKKGASAAASLQKATALFPDNPVAHYYLGRAQELNGNKAAAVAAYQRVTQLAAPESELHKKSAERLATLQPAPVKAPAKTSAK